MPEPGLTTPGGRTQGTLLAGRVRYDQPTDGYRTGLEPVLLAASIPAVPGERVLEGGTGAGAGLLCLAARVAGLVGVGIERDPAMAALARDNLAANGLPFAVRTGDVVALDGSERFAHVMANPPWHDPASTRPPDARRAAATHRGEEGLARWIAALAPVVERTMTLILPPGLVTEAQALLDAAGLGDQVVHPFRPRPGRAARIVLLQAGPGRGRQVAAGLVLHGPDGFTAAAEAILREGARLDLRA